MQVFVFPGQGSQVKGMGGDLFDSVIEYTSVEPQVDEILGYSMRDLCLNDPNDLLGQTQFTQPALYVVNALNYYNAMKEGGKPEYVAGHSLGEYNALLAAGAFDFLTGLKLVQKRGELMAQARDGGMAAIIGIDADAIQQVLVDNNFDGIDIANFNSPSQTVISGPVDQLNQAESAFKDAGVKLYKVLPVSAAFHSRYMKSAGDEFASFLKEFTFNELHTPAVANVTAEPYPANNESVAKELLVKQISGSVQWTQSVRYLKSLGDAEFSEVGPGKVLARLIKQID
ncbi:MAG: ACP S-malonyltransferase [Cellvibrionaceae bacterium]